MSFLKFFHLRENPFGECPDTRFYYPARSHEEVLRKTIWAIEENKSFSLVAGEVGNGKTLLSRMLQATYAREANTAIVVHPPASEKELLETICRDFGVEQSFESLSHALLETSRAGRRNLLLIDEGQCLSDNCLEFIRLLTNLETEKRKLL